MAGQQGQAPAPQGQLAKSNDKFKEISGWLGKDKVQNAIKRVLPKHLSPETFIQIALTTVSRNQYLLDCTPLSIAGAVIEASQLGLSLEPSLGQGYLVPYRNKKQGGRREAKLIPGYRGLVHLARNTGIIKAVSAEVVRAEDRFDMRLGTDRRIEHIPNFKAANRDESKTWIGAYAVAAFTDGSDPEFIYLERSRILDARDRSQSKDDGPWVTDEEEMWRKTPIRRLSKLLPQSPNMLNFHRASAIEENRDLGIDSEPLIDMTELETLQPETDRTVDQPRRTMDKVPETSGEAPKSETKQVEQDLKQHAEQQQQVRDNSQITDEEVLAMQKLYYSESWSAKDFKDYIAKYYGGKTSIKALTRAEYDQVMGEIKAGGKSPEQQK